MISTRTQIFFLLILERKIRSTYRELKKSEYTYKTNINVEKLYVVLYKLWEHRINFTYVFSVSHSTRSCPHSILLSSKISGDLNPKKYKTIFLNKELDVINYTKPHK
jgi:hypothetical protein